MTLPRREFLGTGAAVAAGLLVPQLHASARSRPTAEDLPVALIGAGYQGRILLSALMHIPGVRVRAVSDIWPSAQNYARSFLERNNQPDVQVYEDFREMLEQQRDLSAVLIATPDFAHAAQAQACLEAGLHVYCEPMLAHTLADARSMIQTMRHTGRLLQVGFQRRSHPRYHHALDKLLREAELPGRLRAIHTQWAQGEADLRGWPRRSALPDDVLQRYGYEDMTQFRNWIWFPQYSAGPFCAYVTQQLDICHWFLGSAPQSVMAVGERGFYADRPGLDGVLAVYQYPYQAGHVQVVATLSTTTSGDGMRQNERFYGTEGSLHVAENPHWTRVYREPHAPDWDEWVRKNYVVRQEVVAAHAAAADEVDVHVSGELEQYRIPLDVATPASQLHLENFFAAVRGETQLHCGAEVAYPSHVAAFQALAAAQAETKLRLADSDFHS